jgi:hypothetical protein
MIYSKLIPLLFILFLTIIRTEDRFCAVYSCSSQETEECAKVRFVDFNHENRVDFTDVCQNGEFCDVPQTQWQTFTYLDKNISFSCKKHEIYQTRYPGEECSIDSDCKHSENEKTGKCIDNKCTGLGADETCKYHMECLVGLYCNRSVGGCTKQKISGEKCNSSYECANNLLCHDGTCSVKPYSLQPGTVAGSEEFSQYKCAFGFLFNDMCSSNNQENVDAKTDDLQRCTLGEDCSYIRHDGGVAHNDCECGYSEMGIAYCPRGHNTSK